MHREIGIKNGIAVRYRVNGDIIFLGNMITTYEMDSDGEFWQKEGRHRWNLHGREYLPRGAYDVLGENKATLERKFGSEKGVTFRQL